MASSSIAWVLFHKDPALAIGIICRRQLVNSKAKYLLQPLSYPIQHPPIRDGEIRPWLARTVPRFAKNIRVRQSEIGTDGDAEVLRLHFGHIGCRIGFYVIESVVYS